MNPLTIIHIITRRELGVYMGSAVAYVFLIAYLLLAGILTFTLGGFFEINDASLGIFFNWMPWLLIFLVPSMGMRLWSEERRLGTIEFLLTLPITPAQAVLGKFIASWLFLMLAIALSFPMVITVNILGSPDNGAILAGYVGCFLLAGTYLSIVCLTSALTKNQVIAFILSVLVCLLLNLIGFSPVTDLMARWLEPQSIEGIANFSVLSHFDGFQRGILDSRDLIYFVSVMVFSLYLNHIAVKNARSR
jgi:ABC-2 type transport system permease protein